MNYLPLFIFILVMAITPGPNNILLTVSGTKFGFKKTTQFIIGIPLGLASQVLLFSMGLDFLFTSHPYLKTILKIPGILYILYLAYKLGFKSSGNRDEKKLDKALSVFDGLVFQYLNPKALIMTLTASTVYSAPTMIKCMGYLIIPLFTTSLWALFGSFLGRYTMGKDSVKVNRALGVVTALSVVFVF